MIVRKKNKVLGDSLTQEEYACEWNKSAEHFDKNSHYKWLLDQLGTPGKVLEIGCGSGISTIRIAERAESVVAVDASEFCLSNLELKINKLPIKEKISLYHYDVFSENFLEFLSEKKFDTVVLWLPGADNEVISKNLNINIEEMIGTEHSDYRENIVKKSIEVASVVLDKGGVLQIAMRSLIGLWSDKDGYRDKFAHEYDKDGGDNFKVEKKMYSLIGWMVIYHLRPYAILHQGI